MTRRRDLEAEVDREYRVEMVARVCLALLDGRQPDPEARAFVAISMHRWLLEGGDLARHLRVVAPRGSRRTVDAIAREFLAPHRL